MKGSCPNVIGYGRGALVRRTALRGYFLLCCLFGASCLAACTTSMPAGRVPDPGTYTQPTDFRFSFFKRTYRIHIPVGYTASRPHPLVVVLHGAFSSAEEIERITGFSGLADREGFVALYPNGIGLFGWLRHWNGGHCCGKAMEADVDDVGFLDAVIDEVSRRLAIDTTRIYVAGHSNGGMMAYRYAAERSNKVAAVAVVAGSIGSTPSAGKPEWRAPKPARPVPAIIFHSTDDPRVPYDGGPDPHGSERVWISAPASARIWAGYNGCPPGPRVTSQEDIPLVLREWGVGTTHAETRLYTFTGWQHTWPGPYLEKNKGSVRPGGFDAAALVWTFFKNRRGPGPGP